MPSAWPACWPTSTRSVANKAGASPLLVGTGKDQVHLLVVMTAERGLCGGFNSNIARLARQDAVRLAEGRQDGQDPERRPQGLRQHAPRCGRQVVDRVDLKGVKQLTFPNAEDIADKVLAMFEAGEFDVATLYFSEFKSVIAQKPTALQLIPAQMPEAQAPTARHRRPSTSTSRARRRSSATCSPRNIATQIFRGLLENAASEQGARMSAMDNATRNAGDMINKLTIRYNRQRQANITKELIEIISGAEAL